VTRAPVLSSSRVHLDDPNRLLILTKDALDEASLHSFLWQQPQFCCDERFRGPRHRRLLA
jgi:hypothetical protein